MGIQDVHIIENEFEYVLNPDVALGSYRWINCLKYSEEENNTRACIDSLRREGYTIAATLPNEGCVSIEEVDVSQKIALVFGNEKTGLSEVMAKEADIAVKIPMFGFTESFNISVSVALCLYDLMQRLRKSDIDWRLSDEDKLLEKIKWARHSINTRPDAFFDSIASRLFPHYWEAVK